ncbi:unnamed protein product [Phytophthora fragariaefolia]|uniref:Unnamed protein product n=1 Tax=Phytophthora fragariaefolia TaxID=1490495 RepID=A0A9W7CXE2_9STRA|nr:unnamed protein product [Phytophthora fragariaefolia]
MSGRAGFFSIQTQTKPSVWVENYEARTATHFSALPSLLISIHKHISPPQPTHQFRDYARELAKQRVARVFREGGEWRLAAVDNDVPYGTARRAILSGAAPSKPHGGVRPSTVKMAVDTCAMLEEYLDEDCRMTLTDMCDRLQSDMGIRVGKSSVHRALQGMLYVV